MNTSPLDNQDFSGVCNSGHSAAPHIVLLWKPCWRTSRLTFCRALEDYKNATMTSLQHCTWLCQSRVPVNAHRANLEWHCLTPTRASAVCVCVCVSHLTPRGETLIIMQVSPYIYIPVRLGEISSQFNMCVPAYVYRWWLHWNGICIDFAYVCMKMYLSLLSS